MERYSQQRIANAITEVYWQVIDKTQRLGLANSVPGT
jgi:hypothetical protein